MQICYKGEEYKKERDKDTDKDKKRRTRKITRDPISKTFEAVTLRAFYADHGYGLLVYLWGRECQVRVPQGLCGDGRTSIERHRSFVPDTQFREVRPNAGATSEMSHRSPTYKLTPEFCYFDLWCDDLRVS